MEDHLALSSPNIPDFGQPWLWKRLLRQYGEQKSHAYGQRNLHKRDRREPHALRRKLGAIHDRKLKPTELAEALIAEDTSTLEKLREEGALHLSMEWVVLYECVGKGLWDKDHPIWRLAAEKLCPAMEAMDG